MICDPRNRMKSAYFKIHMGKNPPPQNDYQLKSIFLKSTNFTSSTFPIQPDFSQNQPAAITLNTGSPGTLPDAHLTTASRVACPNQGGGGRWVVNGYSFPRLARFARDTYHVIVTISLVYLMPRV